MSEQPEKKTPRNTCPDCGEIAGGKNGKAHCTSRHCHWTRCQCGTTYDRLQPGTYSYREPAGDAK